MEGEGVAMAGKLPELEVPFGRPIRVHHDLDVRLVLEDMFCKFELWALGAASAWGDIPSLVRVPSQDSCAIFAVFRPRLG